uniref:GNAT family N-acetyltransferase n=1 Tax=candidate division CPR3 bacterium TaxID=2268181 RepID=A0A7C4R533_UNCC3
MVKSEKDIIGYAVGYVLQDKKNIEMHPLKRGYIDELYLKEKYRSQGIGKELLEKFEKHYRKLNCDTIGFNALIANTKAIDFYLKSGFEKRSLFLSKALKKEVKK